MDIGPQQLAERAIYELVALQWPQPGEGAGDDPYPEMPAAVARAGMACMAVAVVDQLHGSSGQIACEPGADPFQSIRSGGRRRDAHWFSVSILDASQKPCASANSKVRPMVP